MAWSLHEEVAIQMTVVDKINYITVIISKSL